MTYILHEAVDGRTLSNRSIDVRSQRGEEEAMSHSAMKTRQARILVVDDDPTVRLLLEFQLKRAGYDVCIAHFGQEAIEASKSLDPDAIVLDLCLPDGHGLGVLRSVRATDRQRHRPIIVLSASVQHGAGLAELRDEADAVEAKPLAPSTLKRLLLELNIPPRMAIVDEDKAHARIH